jgi:NAD(P)-dependent dehydrogenase (short-subunit alcohol dehydrogenase family)
MNDLRLAGLLEGHVAAVTGAAQGNGEGIARGLAAAGAAVAILDLDLEKAQAVAEKITGEGGRAVACKVDVTDYADCGRAAAVVEAALGTPSILVNNAGVLIRARVDDDAFLDSISRQHDINLLGPANMVKAFLPALTQTRGRVVNVGSTASFRSPPAGSGYAASKGALLQLTKVLAAELAPSGIRVNGIAPGLIATRMSANLREDEETAARILARTPIGRFGDPTDLAGPVVFLVSDMSSYVTGVMIPVDGGQLTL